MTVQSPCQRTTPFLHRTWRRGVRALQESSVMGNIISSPVHKAASHHHAVHADADADANGHGPPNGAAPGPGAAAAAAAANGPRPAKRRRLSSPDSFHLDALVAEPRAPDPGSTLRIEVLKILHKDSKKVKSYHAAAQPLRDVVASKARCRVTILDLSSGPPRVLHCQSQLCDLVAFKNPVGPHRVARVDLPRPFYVPHDSILINRPDDGRFDLSDSYQLLVELEAANSLRWPPLDWHDFGLPAPSLCAPWASTQHWVLSSRLDSVDGRLRHPLSLSATSPSGQYTHQTDYVVDVDLRWASGFKALDHLDRDARPCITAIDPEAAYAYVDNAADAANGHVNGDACHHHDQDDDFAGDQTPSRSLRTREKAKVYNLKVLSDQAQGRDGKRRGRSASVAPIEGRVQYLLPSDQPVCLDFYRCVSCGAYHDSMPQLQLHLQMAHPTYDYVLETTGQGPQFRVSALRDSFASPSKTLQLGRQAKAFNLHTLTAGDQSWVASRVGPDNDEASKSPPARPVDRFPSGSPVARGLKTASRRTPRPKSAKALVPNVPQPIYHPISKARLKPGQEVPETPPDDSWLIQKHRESIADFSDVTAAEKEYIWEWDGYILRKSITSVAYFPQAWLAFVKEKAAWLVAQEHRMLEFGKHSSVLLARDVLDDKVMRDAFVYINDARARIAEERPGGSTSSGPTGAAAKLSPRSSQIRKSANGCTVCELPVLGPTLLICANKSCRRRLYHSTCIKKQAIMPVTQSDWTCNACCRSQTSSSAL